MLADTVDHTIGALAMLTAALVSTSYTSLQNAFLVKKVKINLTARNLTIPEGPCIVGLCAGNATSAEVVASVLAANLAGPADVTQSLLADQAWVVWRNTITPGKVVGDGTQMEFQAEISLGKGIPALEALDGTSGGLSVFLMNMAGTDFTTGGTLEGYLEYWGVWLND